MTLTTDDTTWHDRFGDMSPDAFREYGHQIVNWIADYFADMERYPVMSQVRPGDICCLLPDEAPEHPEGMEDILHDFEQIIVPGITHWNHPGFLAYFAITGSGPGVLGEFLSAALNVNAMLWRTSPAATELEITTLGWLRRLLRLPETFEGVIYDTASISSLVGIVAAREATALRTRDAGMAGRPEVPRLRLYCSDQAHSSIEKAAITLGIGLDGVRKIPVDDAFRMRVPALEAAIREDEAAGWRPFCVVATVGTTSTTSVDPVLEIARVCRTFQERHGGQWELWLHVDGAYGGMAAILPEMRHVLDGVEAADSLVVNPHKWLFTPIDLSAFYSPRLDVVRSAFSLIPEYLRTGDSEEVRNYMDYGPQLGRRFRALKLWFVLRSFGRNGIIERLREHMRLAHLFAHWIEEDSRWKIMAPYPFSTICFRFSPPGWSESALDRLNQRILDTINATGEVYLSHTRLHDRLTLRLAVGNLRTEERHIRRAWDHLQSIAEEISTTPTE